MKMTDVRRIIAVVAVFVVLIVSMIVAYAILSDKAVEGQKTITVKVVMNDGTATNYTIKTTEEFLRGAIDTDGQIKLEGEEGDYGLYLKTVNGVTVNETAQEWWCLTKNGETHMYGFDTTVIMDGEQYEITFTVGYDSF